MQQLQCRYSVARGLLPHEQHPSLFEEGGYGGTRTALQVSAGSVESSNFIVADSFDSAVRDFD